MSLLPENPTVYLIEDDSIMRKVICTLLEPMHITVKAFEEPCFFLKYYDKGGLDSSSCIISDLRLPSMSGLELFALLKYKGCHQPIILISSYANVKTAVDAIRSGVFDFISKPFDNQELIDSIQRAFIHLKRLQPLLELQKKVLLLSRRENEILKTMLAGQRNKEISYDLGISSSTVEIHRINIMKKLEIKSLPELLKYSELTQSMYN